MVKVSLCVTDQIRLVKFQPSSSALIPAETVDTD